MDKYILEYYKAKSRLKKSNFLDRIYWRRRIIFLHKILKEKQLLNKI